MENKILRDAYAFVCWYRNMVIEGAITANPYAIAQRPCSDYELQESLAKIVGKMSLREAEDRIRMFMERHGYKSQWFEFTRIALNMDQVQQYNPPPNPAKSTDSRFQGYMDEHGDESWELDALEPQVLSDLIRGKVDELRDDSLYAKKQQEENCEKEQLEKVSERWEEVAEFVEEQ